MKSRSCYEKPEAELLVIHYEEGLLQVSFNDDWNEKLKDGGEEDFDDEYGN